MGQATSWDSGEQLSLHMEKIARLPAELSYTIASGLERKDFIEKCELLPVLALQWVRRLLYLLLADLQREGRFTIRGLTL